VPGSLIRGPRIIVATTRALCEAVKQGTLSPSDITEESFQSAMQTADLPQLDLLIRTSGEVRAVKLLALGIGLYRALLHRHPLARIWSRRVYCVPWSRTEGASAASAARESSSGGWGKVQGVVKPDRKNLLVRNRLGVGGASRRRRARVLA